MVIDQVPVIDQEPAPDSEPVTEPEPVTKPATNVRAKASTRARASDRASANDRARAGPDSCQCNKLESPLEFAARMTCFALSPPAQEPLLLSARKLDYRVGLGVDSETPERRTL